MPQLPLAPALAALVDPAGREDQEGLGVVEADQIPQPW